MYEKNKRSSAEKEFMRRKEEKGKTKSEVEIDPMDALFCCNSASLLSAGVAVPVINLPDREDEEKKLRE